MKRAYAFLPSRTTWFSQAVLAFDPGLSGWEVIEWRVSVLYKPSLPQQAQKPK